MTGLRSKTRLAAATAALALALPALALAQKDKPADKSKPPSGDKGGDKGSGAGTDVQMEEDDTPPADMEGTSENPDAPKLTTTGEVAAPAAPKPVRTGYPIEEVLRPITLPAVTSEVALDARSTFSSLDSNFGLRLRYGITRQAQLGVRYLIGGFFDSPNDTMASTKFNTGKAVGVDFEYLVFDWLAGQVSFPMYVQPFAIGMDLGAPMKFRFDDKFAIVALDDFLDIRLNNKFIPSLTDERKNAEGVRAVDTHTTTASANINVRAGVEYQVSPQLAVKGDFVQTIPTGTTDSFSNTKNPFGLEAYGQYSPSNKLDVVGRIGIDALDSAGSTFGLMIGAAYRI